MEEEKRKGVAGDRRGRRRWGRRKASRWLQTRPCPTPPTWTPKCSPCSTCPPCSTRRTRVGCSWRFAASSSVRSARDQIASASLLTHHPTWKCRTAGWPPATIVLRWAFSLMCDTFWRNHRKYWVLNASSCVNLLSWWINLAVENLNLRSIKVFSQRRVALTSLMTKVICSSWMNWKNSSERIKSKRRGISQVIKISQRSPVSHSAEAWKCTSSFKPLLALICVISD